MLFRSRVGRIFSLRFMRLIYCQMARATGLAIWQSINLINLRENILPTRQRADLILRKGADHAVETVALRKL